MASPSPLRLAAVLAAVLAWACAGGCDGGDGGDGAPPPTDGGGPAGDGPGGEGPGGPGAGAAGDGAGHDEDPDEGEGEGEAQSEGEGEGEDEGEDEGEGTGSPRTLCGDLAGTLPAGVYFLDCASTVATGASLSFPAGGELRLSAHALAVAGTLSGAGLTIVAEAGGGLTVRPGGTLDLAEGAVLAERVEAGQPLIQAEGGLVRLSGTDLAEAGGGQRREGLRAAGAAAVELQGVRVEGFWIGVSAEGDATGRILDATFADCLTGVRMIGGAQLSVLSSRFVGPGFHFRLTPAFFGRDRHPDLNGNIYMGGVPFTIAGQVSGEVDLQPTDGVSRMEVHELGVPAGARLNLQGGLTLALLGATIDVAGTLDAQDVAFDGVVAPAIAWTGGGGNLSDVTFTSGDAAGVTLVRVDGGEPVLLRVRFVDAAGGSTCLKVTGGAPALTDAAFDGCFVGVQVEGGTPSIGAAALTGHATGVELRSAGAVLRDLTFGGGGAHLFLGPDWFAGGDPDDLGLAGHRFGDAGEPLLIGGALTRDATLEPLAEGEPLVLAAVNVRRGATLAGRGGLELIQRGTAVTVDGAVDLDGVLFSRVEGPVLHFRRGGGGTLRRSRVEVVARGAFPALVVTDSSPTLEDTEVDGSQSGGGAVGVQVVGSDDVDDVAAPTLARNRFAALRIGVHVLGDAEPDLVDNTFEDVADEVVRTDGAPP